MNTALHQAAFPGEDISDRPPPEDSVPALLELLEGDLPSGRYRAADLGAATPPSTVVPATEPSGGGARWA
jgi:hypothetical protein